MPAMDNMQPREKYHHPFQPYDIQLQLMKALYDCIEQGKIGIFESPTGTGKSLSLACASLTWLRDHKRQLFDESLSAIEADSDEPAWMIEHLRAEKKREVLHRRVELEARLRAIRRQEQKIKARSDRAEPLRKRRKVTEQPDHGALTDEEQFALDDYLSDEDSAHIKHRDDQADLGLSKETQALMLKLGHILPSDADTDEFGLGDELKIFFCSRTHSQLSQFVGELRRINLPPALPRAETEPDSKSSGEQVSEELKHLSLGSRKNLCINPKVSALRHPTAINERCLELQEAKTPADRKCAYVPNKENETAAIEFRNHSLAKIRDIEDLASLGERLGVCPYYASRAVVQPSEIVALPYPLLLQKTARQALGLSLTDHVIVIDEAHNLMDAILGTYTIEVSLAQLQRARQQLTIYLQKFRNKLKGKNRVYVTQVVRLLDSLAAFLQAAAADSKSSSRTVNSSDLLLGKGVDQINLYKLIHYLQESKLARKVEGYVSFEQQLKSDHKDASTTKQGNEVAVPVLTHLENFLFVLTNPAREGRFFYIAEDDSAGPRLKYMLLDPSEHFRDIVEEARAVILAGGTMSPMDDYVRQLFPYLPSERLTTMSCGHVIPASNLFVSPVVQTSSGGQFDFTFTSRNSPSTIASLGEALTRILPLIPDGCVIFFPSYAYLDQVVAKWQQKGSAGEASIWTRLEHAKPVFREAKSFADDSSVSTEDVLSAYSAAINTQTGRGALLLAVIGGKLSEGINFSDRLGRCVIVVGLPYPNPNSPEWRAKMEFIENKAAGKGLTKGIASREFAENVCMRAVNQAIGRAVRHIADWSAILLIDHRYGQKRIKDKLPGWIQASLPREHLAGDFKVLEDGLRTFYAEKKRA